MATEIERLPREPRKQLKARRKAFRKHWPLLGAIVLGFSVVAAVVAHVVIPYRNVPGWTLGPMAIVTGFWAVRSHLDGTYNLESGLEAEGWTSRDLHKALGRGWHVIDNISFGDVGNVDHVVVGPSGVFAVETKYSDSTMDSRKGRAMVDDWIDQSYEGARRIRLLLKHNYGHAVSVQPIVVASGTEFLTLPAEVEDTRVLRRGNLGSKVAEWRAMPEVLSGHEVEAIQAALLDWQGIRDDHDRGKPPE